MQISVAVESLVKLHGTKGILFLLSCLVARSCLTLLQLPSGSSVHGIFQARILEWVAISSVRGFSQTRDQTCVSCLLHWLKKEKKSPNEGR